MLFDRKKQERVETREKLSRMKIEDLRTHYGILVERRSGQSTISVEEEVTAELLDENSRRNELSLLSTLTLETTFSRSRSGKNDEEMTTDERLISDILVERNQTPLETPLSESE
ncbi:MAG: hypothetical protein Q8L36_00045 [bacterium]|nr:hypothetical protein [bacterium]